MKYRIKKVSYKAGDPKYYLEQSNFPFIWEEVLHSYSFTMTHKSCDELIEAEAKKKAQKLCGMIAKTEIIYPKKDNKCTK